MPLQTANALKTTKTMRVEKGYHKVRWNNWR